MEHISEKSVTHEIIRLLSKIEGDKLERELKIDDLTAVNESQKTMITIMRHRDEAHKSIIDRTLLCMFASVAVNFLTIGWIVYSAF